MNIMLKNPAPDKTPDKDTPEERERKRKVYQNVLAYPKGWDYLKYFYKNPHPERYSDKELAHQEAFSELDLNVGLAQKLFEFELVKKFLDPQLSDFDRKLMRMPEKLQKMIDAGGEEDQLKAYEHLRDCFLTYFSTPLDPSVRPDIQWLGYKFATNFAAAQSIIADLKNNLFNSKASAKLVEKLKLAGAFGDRRKDFYFWNSSPHDWPEISCQARSIPEWKFPFSETKFALLKNRVDLPPQYLALGSFTINALPECYVQPKGNGKYDICVNKMYFFVNDIFNFEGFEPLGAWDLDRLSDYVLILPNPANSQFLFNHNFRNFRRHGYGRYFPVLSKLHEVEAFQPVCREYDFVK